ncbi:MAG TPA: hypothetical protein VH332_06725, partial [Nitrospira sp.]
MALSLFGSASRGAYGLVDLLCSPNARTRSIVLLDRRRSSKRAIGDQSAHAPKKETSKLGRIILKR